MRNALVLAPAGLALIAACSKAPTAPPPPSAAPAAVAAAPAAPASSSTPAAPAAEGPQVSGVYIADGKAASLTEVTAHKDDPFDGQPITALVFTAKDQVGDADAAMEALFGKFGDAIVVKTEPDGSVVGFSTWFTRA